MANQNHYFDGFPKFEQILFAATSKILYLHQTTVIDHGSHMQMSNRTFSVTAGNVGGNGVCHYWRMILGSQNFLAGMEDMAHASEIEYQEKARARAVQVEDLLTKVAKGYGFGVIPGMLALPKDITVLRGDADCLTYDKETNLFTLYDPMPAYLELETFDFKAEIETA